jgi:hypothetical protein
MNKLLAAFVVLLALSGCASVPMGDAGQDAALKSFTVAPDKAGIYVYRNESIGAAIKMDVAIDGFDIGQTAAKTYLYTEVAPGFHTIISKSENVDTIGVEIKPGTLTYIWQEVKMGALYARTKLHLVDEAQGRKGVQESKLAMTKSGSPVAAAPRPTPGANVSAAPVAAAGATTTMPASATAAAAAAAGPVSSRPGVRMTFLDKDPVSGAPIGETTLVLVGTTSTQRTYNDGALITSLDGTPVKGNAHSIMIYGIGLRELQRGGSWSGMYRANSIPDDVPVTFTVIGKQAKVISGHRFEATRIRLDGYATRALSGSGSTAGAPISGEALVDNATGLVLELDVTCRHPSYPIRRELVRVSG